MQAYFIINQEQTLFQLTWENVLTKPISNTSHIFKVANNSWNLSICIHHTTITHILNTHLNTNLSKSCLSNRMWSSARRALISLRIETTWVLKCLVRYPCQYAWIIVAALSTVKNQHQRQTSGTSDVHCCFHCLQTLLLLMHMMLKVIATN